MILSEGIPISYGEVLQCNFRDVNFDYVGTLYSCHVTSLDNSFNDKIIQSYNGDHMTNKNINDVKGISIANTNTKYLPLGVARFFSITDFFVYNSIVGIKSKDFETMPNLQHLILMANKLTTIPSDAFSLLTKLKMILLEDNQIEEIPKDLFLNNLNLEEIYLQKNKIKFIGSSSFNGLKLNTVYLNNNICINKNYKAPYISNQLKEDIENSCLNPNELKERILILKMDLSEAKKLQQNEQIILEKVRNELLVAKTDLLEANKKSIEAHDEQQKTQIEVNKLKEDQQKTQLEVNKLLKERDDLKNDLTAAKVDQQKKTVEINKLTNERNLLKKQVTEAMENQHVQQIDFQFRHDSH